MPGRRGCGNPLRHWLLPLFLASPLAACAHGAGLAGDETPMATESKARAYHVIDGTTGDPVAEVDLDGKLRAARVIYVGEHHDDPHHHHVQALVFERLHGLGGSLGLGLEMLTRDKQNALSAFVAETTDQAEFLKAVDWENTWGFPFGLYAPMLLRCRDNGLPAFALNIPRETTRALSKKGIDGLSDDERSQLPQLEPGPAAHREYVREAYGKHSRSRFTETKFERFYYAQLAWDEGMAETAARALEESGIERLMVVAGEGHTRRSAIPDRAARRGAGPHLTILAIEPDEVASALDDQAADLLFVFDTQAAAAPAAH